MVTGEQAKSTHSSEPAVRNRGPEERAQLHLRLQYTVAQILSSARNEHEACAGILSTICENLGWQWGAFWIRRSDELRLLGCWHSSECGAQEFDQISRTCVFRKGEGMPGKVWAEGAPVWIPDFPADTDMPRRLVAARCNFHSAIGIPICGQEFLGVIELFDYNIIPQDSEFLKLAGATGAQIGQFLERKRTEQALAESQGLFQGVFQGARDAILLANDHGKCIEGNSAALKLFASSREQLLEKSIWDLVPFGPAAERKSRWNEIVETQGLESEFTMQRDDGAMVDFEYRATPRVIPGVHLLVLRDMTGRKSRERSTRILAAAGAILGEGLDFKATLNRVARVAIPEFADWCVLDLLSADGNIERAAIAHADPNV
ncbi:MAG TPA: GAF domain-containing protein, partial [Verrucomicrobiae bacterium]